MASKYEILEDCYDTSVYEGDVLIAVFYGKERSALAQRFVNREDYLDLIAEGLCEYESRVNDDE